MTFNDFRQYGLIISGLAKESGEYPLWLLILLCVIGAVIAYFLGSLNFAIIISKYKFKEDIRTYGSGNGGMTNMLRTYGKAAAGMTLLGDAAKAAVAVLIGTVLAGEAGAFAAGFGCVLGHSFPAYYNFKGGKGIVVTATTVLCLNPLVFIILFAIFVLLVLSTKFLSLGSIIAMMLYPILLNRLYPFTHSGAMEGAVPAIFSLLNTLLVLWLHRENLKRLWNGTENKFSLSKKDKFKKDEKKDAPAEEAPAEEDE